MERHAIANRKCIFFKMATTHTEKQNKKKKKKTTKTTTTINKEEEIANKKKEMRRLWFFFYYFSFVAIYDVFEFHIFKNSFSFFLSFDIGRTTSTN